MPKTTLAYRHDDAGYYVRTDRILPGQVPPNDVLEAPELKDGFWSKWDGSAWQYEKKPTTAQELADGGYVVDHKDHSKHSDELRALMRELAKGTQPGEYRVNQESGTNNLSVVRIPDKTAAELALEAAQKEDGELASAIAALKERYILAQLAGDEELIEDARAEYQALLGI